MLRESDEFSGKVAGVSGDSGKSWQKSRQLGHLLSHDIAGVAPGLLGRCRNLLGRYHWVVAGATCQPGCTHNPVGGRSGGGGPVGRSMYIVGSEAAPYQGEKIFSPDREKNFQKKS